MSNVPYDINNWNYIEEYSLGLVYYAVAVFSLCNQIMMFCHVICDVINT